MPQAENFSQLTFWKLNLQSLTPKIKLTLSPKVENGDNQIPAKTRQGFPRPPWIPQGCGSLLLQSSSRKRSQQG